MKFKNSFARTMLLVNTFRACRKSSCAHYGHAYERASKFFRPAII